MHEHDAVFNNQRLYRVQRNMADGVKGKNSNEDMNMSGCYTHGNASQRQLYGFLLSNGGEGSSSQACIGRLQNGFISKNEVVKPVKAKRKMIDLQLPADQFLDNDEITGKRSASHQSNASGSYLNVKNSNGLADLNEPFKWQGSESLSVSRDMYSHYGRSNNANVQRQNGWIAPEAGHDRRTQRDQPHLPSHSVQLLYNNAFQPQNYPTTDHSKVGGGGRAYSELEVRSKNPQASYGSYMESSVASNATRLHNNYHPDFVRPWSSSSWVNPPMSSSHQQSYPIQTNPYLNFVANAREDSSIETRSRVTNNGFPSVSKEAVSSFPSAGFNPNASFSEVLKQDCSGELPWLKLKPPKKSEISKGLLDLNASFMDETDTGEGVNSVVSSQKGLRSSASCSNNATNVGRVETVNPQSSRNIIFGYSLFGNHSICKEKGSSINEVKHLVKQDIDINLPCNDASVSVNNHGAKEGNKADNFRHYIDLNSCATEEEDPGSHSGLRTKTKGNTWIDLEAPPPLENDQEEGEASQQKYNEETLGLVKGQDRNSLDDLVSTAAQAIVAISMSNQQLHPDDAASSSTDTAANTPLSWFADIIACGYEFERKVNGSPEYSSEEIDYFEAMTLNLQPTKEEDYMPKPLVPENLIFVGTSSNQPRRGQARRGRPKRDFQKNILPGLPSLSRTEITEDFQMFKRLMTTCNSGVATARQDSKRKRPVTNTNQAPVCLSMVQPANESVTGWGQATRRPRRQRCPSTGNPATVMLK